MLKLEYIGVDYWGCPVYKDNTGKLWKDVNLGCGVPALHSSVDNEFDGEPEYPIGEAYEITSFQPGSGTGARTSDFCVGDRVMFTNDYGVTFGPRTITGFREPDPDFLPERTIYIDSDSPWFPVKPSQLRKVDSPEEPA
jgi:hypothetical protein